MNRSFAIRIYRTIFAISFLIIILSLVFIELIYEDMESTILSVELNDELNFHQHKITNDDFQLWQTANITVAFLGSQTLDKTQLPDHFRDLQAPTSREVDFGDEHYLVLAKTIDAPAGTMFISQKITAMEEREILFQLATLVLVIFMSAIGFVLSQLGARKLVKSLQKLTKAIQRTVPGKSMQRLETNYMESEYNNIASAFNRFLEEMESFVARENMFIKTASHELRTPIAILSGALDVIEKRQQLSDADKQTMKRIRQTVSNMQIEVNTLLALLRNESPQFDVEITLGELIHEAFEELQSELPSDASRLKISASANNDVIVVTHHSMTRMLIRNLLHNALQHTSDQVVIQALSDGLQIRDFGQGLPDDIHQQLNRHHSQQAMKSQETRFGLLIAQLISEKLNLKLNVRQTDSNGTTIEIHFNAQDN